MSGWVKIHRQILEWEWYDDINTCRLFFHLLIKANHKERNYKGKVVSVGETLTGLDKLSCETNLSVQQIRTSLNKLKSTNEITINSTSQGTVIKVVNYEKYQVATSEATDEQQTNNKPSTTNKNDKKEKNENNKPILEDVITFFNENNYTTESATKAFNYYHPEWKDSNGRKVLNWKQKMRGVWFKDENLIKAEELTDDQQYFRNVMAQINNR